MTDLREYARAALFQTDAELEADCEWQTVALPGEPRPGFRLRHLPTSISVQSGPRSTEAKGRLIALLQLRNRCYDMVRMPLERRIA